PGFPQKIHRELSASAWILTTGVLSLSVVTALRIGVPANYQQKAIREIERRGGFARGNGRTPPEVHILFGVPISKAFYSVFDVHIYGAEFKDADMRLLRAFPNLPGLSVNDTAITDEGLQELKMLSRLQGLSLSGAAITDQGLKNLERHPRLRSLDLQRT